MMTYTIGDTPTLSGNIGANLTGATLVVNVQRPDGSTITTTGEVVSGEDGAWSAEFDPDDLTQVGWNALEVRVTYSSGDQQTFALDQDDVQMGFFVRAPFAA